MRELLMGALSVGWFILAVVTKIPTGDIALGVPLWILVLRRSRDG